MFVRAVSLLSVAIASSVGIAAVAEPRDPVSKWVAHFDDTQCFAERDYGSEKHLLRLVLKQPPLGDVIQVAVATDVGSPVPQEVRGTIEFDTKPPRKISMLRYGPAGEKLRIFSTNVPIADLALERDARSMRVKTSGLDHTFNTPQFGSVLRVLEQCVTALRGYWNVDGSKENPKLAKPPKGNLQSFFNSEDYPAESIRSDRQGGVGLVLLVDETGKVADCSVIRTSGVAALDAQACTILKLRGKLEPAIGADGKPAKGSLVGSVNWRIAG